MTPDLFRAEGTSRLQALGFEIAVERRRIADLHIRSGRLVACDPFDAPETEPFEVDIPSGRYPVYIVTADLRDTVSIAFLMVEFSDQPATRWELAHLLGDEHEKQPWNDPAHAGFHVESGVAALVDEEGAQIAIDRMSTEAGEDDFNRMVRREIAKTRRANTSRSGWASIEIDEINLIVLEVDNGTYKTHLGRDPDGNPALLVVDLGVLDIQFTPYGLRF